MKKILSSVKAASFIVYSMWQISVCELHLTQVSTEPDGCHCPGDVVTYECTVVGGRGYGGSSIWKGSAFHCPSARDEITLLHFQYSSPEGYNQSCNSGAMFGRSIRLENNSYSFNYTSQLDVTLTSDLVNTWIECAHDDGLSETIVGTLNITAEICDFSTNVTWMTICPESNLFINWSSSVTRCPAIQYIITTSNCGSCPTNTKHNNVTCTDAPTNGSVCTFTIETEVRENITSDPQQFSIRPNCSIINESDGSTTQPPIAAIVSTIVILLLVIIILLIVVIFRKKVMTFISRSRQKSNVFITRIQRITSHQEDTEVKNDYYCNEVVTIKVFDNESNGMYGIEDFGYSHPKTLGSTDNGALDLDSLLMKLQGQVSSHWYRFGLALGLTEDIMKQLGDYSDKNALVELLDYWLRYHSGQPTWGEIEVALKKINCPLLTNGLLETQASHLEFY